MTTKTLNPEYRTIKGKRMVLLAEGAFEKLLRKADLWEPALPEPNERGNYPALRAMAVSIARGILRARRRLGLSQAELARRAGIRPAALNRIEQANHEPSIRTLEKIDRALKEAQGGKPAERNGQRQRKKGQSGSAVGITAYRTGRA
jgi:ribosome-binding protein aMBF1 (putative translation factor)